jgi:hypothetical protein
MDPRDIFISHAEEDGDIAGALARELRAEGRSTWVYEEDAVPGISHLIQSSEAIEACRAFLLIATTNSVQSREVISEVEQAHQLRKVIIPVRLGLTQEQFAVSNRILRMATGTAVTLTAEANNAAAVATRISEAIRAVFESREGAYGLPQVQHLFSPPIRFQQTGDTIRVPSFQCGGVVPPEFFVGRDSQLRDAERIIGGGHNFLVVGNHRDGKTSLCKMLIHRLMNQRRNTAFPIYINVQLWPDVNIETFLEHTILEMIGGIARAVFQCKFTALRKFDVDQIPEHLREDAAFARFSRHIGT